jgi:undecaprenyl pyrophosphate phosphatase UppP
MIVSMAESNWDRYTRWGREQRSQRPFKYAAAWALLTATLTLVLGLLFHNSPRELVEYPLLVALLWLIVGGYAFWSEADRRPAISRRSRPLGWLAEQRLRVVAVVAVVLIGWIVLQYGVASAAPFLLIVVLWALLVRHYKNRGHRF